MGFVIRDMPPQIDPAALRKLAECETATIGHVKQMGFVDPAVQTVCPGKRIAGTAITVALPHQDQTMLSHVLGLLRPGDVLVVDRLGDSRHACFGGGTAAAALASGAVAAVVDGPCADFAEIRDYDFPLWCRGPTAITNRVLGVGGACNVPISCGGVAVLPGHAVLADDGGVLVLSPEECEELADWALAKQTRDTETRARIETGTKMGDISGATKIAFDGRADWF